MSKLEAPKFSASQEAKLTINCFYPMLQSPDRVSVDLTPGGVALDPGNTVIYDDVSNAPHGLRFTMRFTAATDNLVIKDETADWAFRVVPLAGFKHGDVLHYSSEHGAKDIHIVRSGDTIYLADVIREKSVWPIMFPGTNHIKVYAPVVWESIDYYLTYWGI